MDDIDNVDRALDLPSVPNAPNLLKSDILPSYAVSHFKQNLNFPSMYAQEVAPSADEIVPLGNTPIVEGIQSSVHVEDCLLAGNPLEVFPIAHQELLATDSVR